MVETPPTARIRSADAGAERVVVAKPGAPFGAPGHRQRGIAPLKGPLGNDLVQVDWDCCFLDDRRIETRSDWQQVITRGRLADVEGSFALAWQDAAGTHLARDGVGGRSLYYEDVSVPTSGVEGARLPRFATSLHDVLAQRSTRPQLNLTAIARYLATAYVPGRETLIDSLYEVLPGERVTFTSEGAVIRHHFTHLAAAPVSPLAERALRDELRARLERAVRRLLPETGSPVAATLSGGIDSSLVVALAARLHDAPVHTWSVSFGPEHANELEFSTMVARHCRTQHTVLEIPAATILRHLDETIGLLSDPIGDPLTVPNALLFRAASAISGIVLNGEGGDPCFGGPKNQPMVLAELYAMPSGERTSRATSYLRSHLKCYDDFPQLLSSDMQTALTEAPLEDWLEPMLEDRRWPDYVSRLQAMNIALKGAHHILPKVDALSRPFGVLPRSPLFDRSVVDLSLMLPPRLKLHGAVEKHLLKEAVRDLLPEQIIARPKSGMLVPVESWFKGPLLQHARERLLDGLAPYGLFQRDYLERLLAGHLNALRPRHGAKIWLLVTLEAWLRQAVGR